MDWALDRRLPTNTRCVHVCVYCTDVCNCKCMYSYARGCFSLARGCSLSLSLSMSVFATVRLSVWTLCARVYLILVMSAERQCILKQDIPLMKQASLCRPVSSLLSHLSPNTNNQHGLGFQGHMDIDSIGADASTATRGDMVHIRERGMRTDIHTRRDSIWLHVHMRDRTCYTRHLCRITARRS